MDTFDAAPLSYAPPSGRDLPDALARQAEAWVENPVLRQVLEAMEGFVILVNRQHQILMANVPFLRAAHVDEVLDLRGLRLGEVLGCIHVQEGRDGCGTSPACAGCGVAQAVSFAKQGQTRTCNEASLSCQTGHRWEALELRVHAAPLPEAGEGQLLLVCQDIRSEKRRDLLESVFFHDVLNTLGGLRGWVSALVQGLGDPARALSRVDHLSEVVIEEVRSQRLVSQAERGDLSLNLETLQAEGILQACAALAEEHPSSRDRRLQVAPGGPGWTVRTDASLLRRVVLNMTLNALEASPAGSVVTLAAHPDGDGLRFQVHNPGFIPPDIQGRLFQRSFSTKAKRGRGLGTYSMKLLGETYLGGRVSFTTDLEAGTCFALWLPRH